MSTALRVFSPTTDGTGDGSPPRLTLSVLFQQYTLPRLEEEGRSAATIGEYRTHLRRWAEFWQAGGPAQIRPGVKDRPSFPPLDPPEGRGVTYDDLLSFRRWIGKKFDFSNRTKNKHVNTIQAILADGHRHREIPGVISVDPLPETTVALKHYLTEEQLASLYAACEVATWPGKHAPDMWRSAIVMFATYGFRTQELITFGSKHKPLTWGQITWSEETPNPEGQAVWQHGWFWYVPQKQKGHKPRPLYLPITELAKAHLLTVKPRRTIAAEEPVFAFPRCSKKFYPEWEAILRAARLKPKGPAEEQYLPKHLRKTCSTRLNNHLDGLAPLVMGHAARGESEGAVNMKHYFNPEQRILAGLKSLPEPAIFRQIFDREQLRLF